jgi:hypothetical protein
MQFDRSMKAVLAALGLALLAFVRERAYRRGLENGYERGRGPGGKGKGP